MTAEEVWMKIKDHFLKQDDVLKQGESIKIHKRIFAGFQKGNYIVKLPQERVDEIIGSGEGLPHDFGTGKAMKEWVIIKLEFSEKWIDYAREAMDFAKTQAKK